MSLVQEFKAFILRGNVVDMAVGIIIGAAFSGIVGSLVSDILTPPIGWATGGVDFSDLTIDLGGSMIDPATRDKPPAEQVKIPVKIAYGKFLQRMFDFTIIAFCLFLIIKGMNRLKRKEAAKPPEPTASEKLLTEIRDLLKDRK